MGTSGPTTAPKKSKRFAEAVLDAFRAAGRLTDAEVVAAGGPSDSYMTSLRKAAQGDLLLAQPRGHTQRRIERAAGWGPGSTLKVWEGGEPTLASATPPPVMWGGGDMVPAVSDQELIQRLWKLLDERGAVDMFVSEALQAVERRLGEVRAERNRLAHTAAPASVEHLPVSQGEVFTVTQGELEAITDRAVRMVVAQLGHVLATDDETEPLAARRGRSAGQVLRRAQDEAGEESQDNGGEG